MRFKNDKQRKAVMSKMSRYKVFDADGKYWKTTTLEDDYVSRMRNRVKARFVKVK